MSSGTQGTRVIQPFTVYGCGSFEVRGESGATHVSLHVALDDRNVRNIAHSGGSEKVLRPYVYGSVVSAHRSERNATHSLPMNTYKASHLK